MKYTDKQRACGALLSVLSRRRRVGSRRMLVLALLSGASFAQAPSPDQDIRPLAGVVVTATRTADDALDVPAAIDVIHASDIQRAQPRISLSESLQRIPGVVARDRQNHAQDLQISVRGFGARSTFGVRGIRLYTDGIPATMPDGQGQVSHFSLDSADRIEILRGPFSALYGNASGGVIELFSAAPPLDHELEAGHVAGGDGLRKVALSWRGPLGGPGNHGLRVDASEVDTDGYRDHSAAQRRSAQATLKGGFETDTRYTVQLNGVDIEADDPQGLTASELAGDRRAASPNSLRFDARKTVRQQQAGARVEHALSDAQQVVITGYGGHRRISQMLTVPVAVQASPTHGGGAISLDRDYRGVDARLQWNSRLFARPFTLIAGALHEVSDEARRGYENFIGDRLGVFGALRRDEQNRVTGFDQYLQADWRPSDRWRINIGARHSEIRFASRDRYVTDGNPDDSGRLDYSRTSPVAGVLFRAAPGLSLYANAGGGFETPTFAELAYRSDGLSGLNDGLDPARSTNLEVGLRGRSEVVNYSAALFHNRTEDELVVVSNEGGRSVYGNAGESRRRGIELALTGQLSQHWRIATAYTLLDARYLRDFIICATPPCTDADPLIRRGRHIPGLSRHFAWAELRWSPAADADIALEGRIVDRVFANDANSAAAPSYASFDLSAERRVNIGALEWRGFARINNLSDRKIIGSVIVNEANGRYFEPAPGRHWAIGLSATRIFD